MEKYKQYANNVVNGNIAACTYVVQAAKRYLTFFKKYDFRPDEVDKVVHFCGCLRHFTGKNAGKPFVLSDFQFWIVCAIYGFYHKGTDERVTKNIYIELARKNGKSFFAAALALYQLIASGESNAEVEVVANSAKQAGIVFKMCKLLCEGLDKKHKYFKTYRDKIDFEKTMSFLQVLASDASTNDGWNSSLYIVDEYHSAKDSSMYDVLKSSQGMRDNPLAIVITTAGFNLFSPCYDMRRTDIEILSGAKEDDSTFAAIYTLDEGDEWSDPKNFIKSNPNLGITVKESYLMDQIRQAENQPSMEVGVRTKNFNQWLSSSDIWLPADMLLKSTAEVQLDKYNGYIGYCGVDLAAVSDLTAVSLLVIDEYGKYNFKTWYYLPQATLSTSPNKQLYREWVRNKYLTLTPGNVADYDYITADIQRIIDKGIYLESVMYDQYNATQWAIDATAKGIPLKPYSQALWSFNKPTKELERLVKSNKITFDNNPITRWCFANVAIKNDHNDNVKPVKGEGKECKIDGVIAIIQALAGYLESPHYSNEVYTV